MATLTKRLRIKNADGEYDQLCIETPATAVVLSDGTTLEDRLLHIEELLTEIHGAVLDGTLSDIEAQLAAL